MKQNPMQIGDFVVRKEGEPWAHGVAAFRITWRVGDWISLRHAGGNGPRPWMADAFRLAKACEVESQPIREGDLVKQKGGAGSVLTVQPGWHKSVYKDWLHVTAAEYRASHAVPASALSARPSEVSVGFSPEMVARFDWNEDTPASTLLADIAKAEKEMAVAMGIPKELLEPRAKPNFQLDMLIALEKRLEALSNGNGHSFAALATINGQQSEKIDALMTRTDAQAEEIAALNAAAERAMIALEAAPPLSPFLRGRIDGGLYIRVGDDKPAGQKQDYITANNQHVARYPNTLEPIPESCRFGAASILLIFFAVCTAIIITLTTI